MGDYFVNQVKASLKGIYNNISRMPACKTRNELIDLFLEYSEKLSAIRNDPIQDNTRINYLYRDACNYKTWNSVVLKGVMTDEQFSEMRQCCEDHNKDFIPGQVGLDLLTGWDITEDDTPYAELNDFELVPDKATIDMTVEELLERFCKAKDNWEPEKYWPEPYRDEEDEEE